MIIYENPPIDIYTYRNHIENNCYTTIFHPESWKATHWMKPYKNITFS